MNNSTEIRNDYVIENFKCSFLNCSQREQSLVPSDNNFVYFYQKQNPPSFNMNESESRQIEVIEQINTIQPVEIKFICQGCNNDMMKKPIQLIKQISDNINLENQNRYEIFLDRDGRETPYPPKKGKFTKQMQKCKKCLDNEIEMQNFDQNLKNYINNQDDIDIKIMIAKYYAQEQYNKDKQMFQILRQKLNTNLGPIERLMILNKMKMIVKKYE
ncbi:unnamed protein product (macronuclear) [Paramecium tetraurelia]|uniref:Uncharacterized protein n=1 Tax=Paramecium tetraurelia TaxID=5888 RepID=A0C6N3_PARTE|nr:uncharacterized protein GSPATT00035579001 [Paramecium tetraurelia]CAK66450.1 unnamed protein product [Paramecium tetraurelia]|eukprot:XP_001433847.1 hypothetical protein (macronuclear) [Paramecium tetraurelia strain d4-2]